jgi:hypothetical protein
LRVARYKRPPCWRSGAKLASFVAYRRLITIFADHA